VGSIDVPGDGDGKTWIALSAKLNEIKVFMHYG